MSKENDRSGGVVVNVASILGLFCAEQPKGDLFINASLGFIFLRIHFFQDISIMLARVQLSL